MGTQTIKIKRKGFNEVEYTEVELDSKLVNAIMDKYIRDKLLKLIDRDIKEGAGFLNCMRPALTTIEFKKFFNKETTSIRKHYEMVFRDFKYTTKEQNYYEYDMGSLKELNNLEVSHDERIYFLLTAQITVAIIRDWQDIETKRLKKAGKVMALVLGL